MRGSVSDRRKDPREVRVRAGWQRSSHVCVCVGVCVGVRACVCAEVESYVGTCATTRNHGCSRQALIRKPLNRTP